MRCWLLLFLVCSLPLMAQFTFSSGSTSSDGALNLTTPGTIIFDPKSFNPPLNPAGDNVFNFTTINIGAGVTVKLRDDVVHGPVYWLAQGAVTINGRIDLNGANGYNDPQCLTSTRVYSVAGSGGYSGGVGGLPAGGFEAHSSAQPPQPGGGPGGGGTSGNPGLDGIFTGNQFGVPLVGGSGGKGLPSFACAGGGAGGGAILIASSTSISFAATGFITANGGIPGNNTSCGGGSGGTIRVVAPTIAGFLASAGTGGCTASGLGKIRIEAYQISQPLGSNPQFTYSSPVNTFLPPSAPSPSVVVTSVGGIPVSQSPTGAFTIPDVVVNSSGPLPVNIQARNIPLGTTVTLFILSENGSDQTLISSPLTGTLASSTAAATVTLPMGYSRGFVKATWVQ